jgi:Uma2 family endonuclease
MTVQDRPPAPGKYRLRIEDYLTLDASGAFAGARTELVEGEVIVMSPQYRPHGMVKMELYDQLRDALRAVGSPLRPVIEFSLTIDGHSLPEPDIMLTSEPMGEGAVPLASVALVIEVAGPTLASDLSTKARLYAAAGIPEYWVADVEGKVIQQLWAPEDEAYAQRREVAFGARIEAVTVAGLVAETPTP